MVFILHVIGIYIHAPFISFWPYMYHGFTLQKSSGQKGSPSGIPEKGVGGEIASYELCHEKTCQLHMQK